MGDGALTLAWLGGTAIVVYRQVAQSHHMVVPGTILGITGLFAGLAIIGDIVPPARRVTVLLGIGLDLAGLFQLMRTGGLTADIAAAEGSEATAEGES